MTAFASS